MAGKPLFSFGAAPAGPRGPGFVPTPGGLAPSQPIGMGMPTPMGDTRYRGPMQPPTQGMQIGQYGARTDVTHQGGGMGMPMQPPTGMMAQPQAVGMAMSGMSGQPAQAPTARMMVARALQNRIR